MVKAAVGSKVKEFSCGLTPHRENYATVP
jgi:hypothetical protein